MTRKTEIHPDVESLIAAVATRLVESAQGAVRKYGRFLIALSGGRSPLPLYQLLARSAYRDRIPWQNTVVLWSDERCVPLNDERSNAGMAFKLLLRHVPVPEDQILPLYIEEMTPTESAQMYEKKMTDLFDTGLPRLDLTLLGCGEDGHTASLFPGSASLGAGQTLVRAVDSFQGDVPRITMTPQLLNRSDQVFFIVYGRSKAKVVQKVLEDAAPTRELPAQAIHPPDGVTVWFLDREAAADLRKDRTSQTENIG